MFKDILLASGTTCYELSKSSSVSYTVVNELYRGERTIDDCLLKTVIALSSSLGLTLPEFISKCKRRLSIPSSFKPYFWDTDWGKIDLLKNKNYIIPRLLERGDWNAICFVIKAYSREEIKDTGKHALGFNKKTANLLRHICNLKREEMSFYRKKEIDWRG